MSRPERDAQHCERLLVAACQLFLEGERLTVASIAARARVGRSTLYEFFDGPDHLLQHVEQRVVRALEQAFRDSTPNEKPGNSIASLFGVWLEQLEARPLEGRVALTPRSTAELLSPAGNVLREALAASIATPRGVAGGSEDARVLAAVGAVEVLTRRHLSEPKLPAVLATVVGLVSRLLGAPIPAAD